MDRNRDIYEFRTNNTSYTNNTSGTNGFVNFEASRVSGMTHAKDNIFFLGETVLKIFRQNL